MTQYKYCIISIFLFYFYKIHSFLFNNKLHFEKDLKISVPNHLKNNHIHGFYGLIGSDVNTNKITNLYDLFTGNGFIQGIFINHNEIYFIKHYIQTEKLKFEKSHKVELDNSLFSNMIFQFLNNMKMFPNTGTSNTALLTINQDIYSLYEVDLPYLIDIDLKTQSIHTIKKIKIPFLKHFSAHSKFIDKVIHTIDYDSIHNKIDYFLLDSDFQLMKKNTIKTKHMPFIHDFHVINQDQSIVIESPYTLHFHDFFHKKLPVKIKEHDKTMIHLLNTNTGEIDKYTYNDSTSVLHYAYSNEDKENIYIYAPFYDDFDLNSLDFHAKYRRLVLNKKTKNVHFEKSKELEKYNLEFPIQFENKVILMIHENKKNIGFMICDKLKIIKKINIDSLCICGEPSLIYDNRKIPHLVFFAYHDDHTENLFIMINLKNYKIEKIPIPYSLHIGFHSIFIPEK